MNRQKIGLKIFIGSMVFSLASVSSLALAGHNKAKYRYDNDRKGNYRSGNSSSFFDYARVTQADPLFETIEHRVPREECWNEKVPYTPQSHANRRSSHRNSSATPTIIGALIGGALGNELGHHKRNKQVGAVVGAVLGGSIGADVQRQKNRERDADRYDDSYDVAYRNEQRCKTYYDVETEQRLSGYQVSYSYNGHEYETVTDQHPGKKLRVRVGVSPAQ